MEFDLTNNAKNVKMKTFSSLFCIYFLLTITGFSQTQYNQIIDTSALSKAEFINLQDVNTEFYEMSPAIYGTGIVYVSSKPVSKFKKVDKKNDHTCFSLLAAQMTDSALISSGVGFLADLKIREHEGPCSFTKDSKTLFLSRNSRDPIARENETSDIGPFGIYIYKNQNGFWAYDSELPVNSYGYKVFHPAWDEAEQRLIFASDMPGGFGETDLYSLTKTANGWIDLKNLGPEINTRHREAYPFIHPAGFIFYASDKPGGLGGFDLYFSSGHSEKFSAPVNLGKVFNSAYDDFGLAINENNNICYFTSNRPGGKGKDDIYMLKPAASIFRVFNDYYTIMTRDVKNKAPLSDVKITFSKYEIKKNEKPHLSKIRGSEKEIIYTIDTSSLKESKAVFSDKNGNYHIILPDGKYIIKAYKSGYLQFSSLFETGFTNKMIDIEMIEEIVDTFNFSFINDENNQLLNDVSFDITEGKPVEIGKSNDNIYFISVLRGNSVKLRTTEKDYLPKEIQIDKTITPAIFDIVLSKKPNYVTTLPTAEGETFILQDILYDYNSFIINDKAKKELNRLADHLKKYPEIKIELSSHTDSRGNDDFNTTLSMKRSDAAKKYLISKGINPVRITAIGFGEKKLKNHCSDSVNCTENEHAENRRTEIKVIR